MSSSTRQTSVSPVAIISLVVVALYCAGFVRVEVKFHDQDKRIEALEAIFAQNGYPQQFVSSADKQGELFALFVEFVRKYNTSYLSIHKTWV